MMSDLEQRFKRSIIRGLQKGFSGFIWLIKIVIPISLFTAILFHFKVLHHLDFFLAPFMELMGLPASAILVIIAGMFTGVYGAIGALSVIHFSVEHVTLIAIFVLIAHNLIQESIIQDRTGLNGLIATCFRLVVAFITTFVCAKIMGVTPGMEDAVASADLINATIPFTDMLKSWIMDTVDIILQIFFIIMPLMIVIELARNFHLIEIVTKVCSPVLRVLGIDRSCGMLWLTAVFFGLSYGATVIQEETQVNVYEKDALRKLHLSIGVNHSMIEDPLLFMSLGLSIFWLWIPRLIAAASVVWLYSLFSFVRKSYVK